MTAQNTNTLMMIRPVQFRFNEQTAVNNYYQKAIEGLSKEEIQQKAEAEFENFVEKLVENGVNVVVFDDTKEPDTPDSIFPNNWVSFHEDGRVALYPMYAENRRLERRHDLLDALKEKGFEISSIIDYSDFEENEKYLEGTGAMIFDRDAKIVYAALSSRSNKEVLDKFCDDFDYRAVTFTANQTVEGERLPIYHTNVMMCIANKFAILCADSIDNEEEREEVINSLSSSGKEVIQITEEQKHHFAGNMLQVLGEGSEPILVMSEAARKALTQKQINTIEAYCPTLYSSLDTIEALGGGSARCMMAEVFLPKKEA